MSFLLRTSGLIFGILLNVAPTLAQTEVSKGSKRAIIEEQVIAGGPKDFMEVRHLILQGSNEEIGRALAAISRDQFGVKPQPSTDGLRTRVQRKYIEKSFPILFDRMRGVASAFERSVDDDGWNFSGLHYPASSLPGCSVMYFPPRVTATGTGIISRDYDFTTGTFLGTWPASGQLPCTARPYVIEMYPKRGYPSIALYSYDLLSGVLDGINSEGLTVALLADDELATKFRLEPAGPDAVGLGVLQTLRLLLDTCATVQEAKEALLLTKQYYEFLQVHYLIADRHGQSFVWEYSQAHNREYIVENPDKPLITTNFSLHRYLDGKSPPSSDKAKTICPRYCLLADFIAKNHEKLTVDAIKEAHKKVDAVRPSGKDSPRAPGRTLWHALYVPENRTVEVSFYLRDEPDPDHPEQTRIVRSEYQHFALKDMKSKKE
jgi:hypothetical protein